MKKQSDGKYQDHLVHLGFHVACQLNSSDNYFGLSPGPDACQASALPMSHIHSPQVIVLKYGWRVEVQIDGTGLILSLHWLDYLSALQKRKSKN